PQADVVRNAWPADGAEVDRIHGPQSVEAIGVHHQAHVQVVLAAPREALVVEAARCNSVEHAESFGHDLLADAVAGDDGDPKALGHTMPPVRLAECARWC